MTTFYANISTELALIKRFSPIAHRSFVQLTRAEMMMLTAYNPNLRVLSNDFVSGRDLRGALDNLNRAVALVVAARLS